MSTNTQFKLESSKPGKDFIEWNEQISRNFDQDSYYKESHPFILWVEKMRLATISKLIKKHMQKNNLSNPVIIEAGCGTGQVLEEISNKVNTNNLIGIDPLDSWLQKAQDRLGNKVKLINGLAEDLPFKDSSADFVVCTEVLEHIIDPKVALCEFSRVIKNDGLIIVSIPNECVINNLKEILDQLKIYKMLFPNIQKHNDWHLHSLDLKSFKKYIPKGLHIQSLITIPTFLLPLRYTISFYK